MREYYPLGAFCSGFTHGAAAADFCGTAAGFITGAAAGFGLLQPHLSFGSEAKANEEHKMQSANADCKSFIRFSLGKWGLLTFLRIFFLFLILQES